MTLLAALMLSLPALAQPPAPAPAQTPAPPPTVVSPDVQPDRRVTFRIYAPKADAVRLVGSDIPNNGPGTAMTKADDGIWTATLGPLDAGAYRYNFNVNGVSVIDPRNPAISESNTNVWSLVYVPGSELWDTRRVPHGAVAAVHYYSTSLGRFRRMHVYTPPGYELGRGTYPVFYLLHGAGDSDHAWSSVGRAGFIIDNLIAAGKAKPMIVVMPAGHTSTAGFNPRASPDQDEFARDFVNDVMPYVEKNYRVKNDRADRAIAGLSMGGSQSLNVAVPHLDKFAYVGVFSSGIIGAFFAGRGGGPPPDNGAAWVKLNERGLNNAAGKKGLKLLWFSTGSDDFLLNTTKASVELFKKHGFDPVYVETTGGHTWINWRIYLAEFAPKLFQ
jgi:enterochelin esterase-like enzyme